MGVFKAIVCFLGYLFHTLLALCLLALSSLALATGANALRLNMLPWTGSTLAYAILFGSLVGLLTILLALKATLRPLFFLWSLAVFAMLVKGFLLSPYQFDGLPGFRSAGLLTSGALLAVVGAWFQMTRGKPNPTTRR